MTSLPGPLLRSFFPVPWARTAESSFLASPDELCKLLQQSGFKVTAWFDTTDAARTWFVSLAAKIRRDGMPTLGFQLLLGPDFQVMAQNQRRNLEEARIELAQVVARRS
jgi:MPBQ/MSBQ methyltransferase